jgi:hypothetical protein
MYYVFKLHHHATSLFYDESIAPPPQHITCITALLATYDEFIAWCRFKDSQKLKQVMSFASLVLVGVAVHQRYFKAYIRSDDIWAVAKNEDGKSEIANGYHDKRIKVTDNRTLIMFYDVSKTNESWKTVPFRLEHCWSNASKGHAFI